MVWSASCYSNITNHPKSLWPNPTGVYFLSTKQQLTSIPPLRTSVFLVAPAPASQQGHCSKESLENQAGGFIPPAWKWPLLLLLLCHRPAWVTWLAWQKRSWEASPVCSRRNGGPKTVEHQGSLFENMTLQLKPGSREWIRQQETRWDQENRIWEDKNKAKPNKSRMFVCSKKTQGFAGKEQWDGTREELRGQMKQGLVSSV